MANKKPLLMGLDNPYSLNPRAALLPRPKNSAGHRLFVLSGLRWSVYREAFDRRNVVDGVSLELLRNRTVIVLGHEAWRRLGLKRTKLLREVWTSETNTKYVLIPHTSGRNSFYNRRENRAAVSAILMREAML